MIDADLASHVLKALEGAKTEVAAGIAPEQITLEEIMAVAKRADEMMSRAPFQLNENIADDLDMLVKIDGKIFMGRRKWHQFNRFSWPVADYQGAERWLAAQKIYDLDAIGNQIETETARLFKGGAGQVAGISKGLGAVGGSAPGHQAEDHSGAESE